MSLSLTLRNFAQIREVSVVFGDLTLLVGPQATGKSLLLQWLKFALDGREVVQALRDAGHPVNPQDRLLDLLFGVGMGRAWRGESQVLLNGKEVKLSGLSGRGSRDGKGRVFYIPAHRALLMADGWAAPFQRLAPGTPVVARIFSQHLYERLNDRSKSALFPSKDRLKAALRRSLDDALFHGGRVEMEESSSNVARRIVLKYEDVTIPYMAWSAGQREFVPLLLGLYSVLPPSKKRQAEPVEWVILEEPEMGLHPKAVNVVVLLILELLWRGYRVAVSTHSADLVAACWMLQRLRETGAGPDLLLEGLDVRKKARLRELAETALGEEKNIKVYAFLWDDQQVKSQDISGLDPGSLNPVEGEWGGLVGFATRYGETVAKAVAEAERAAGEIERGRYNGA